MWSVGILSWPSRWNFHSEVTTWCKFTIVEAGEVSDSLTSDNCFGLYLFGQYVSKSRSISLLVDSINFSSKEELADGEEDSELLDDECDNEFYCRVWSLYSLLYVLIHIDDFQLPTSRR